MEKTKKLPGKGIKSRDEKIVTGVSYVVMTLLALMTFLPFMHMVSKAVSSSASVNAGSIIFWPVGMQFETLYYVLFHSTFPRAMFNTVFVTVAGTILSMFTTITTAYPLAKSKLKGRGLLLILYVISMVFYGGIVPAYMVIRTLGILDTHLALILPFVIIQFNMFIVKNYFESLPESIEESAMIDGAGYGRILVSIVCPISKPVIATVSLLYAVNYWNNYFHAMMYTNSPDMRTLQMFIYDTIYDAAGIAERMQAVGMTNISVEGMRSASVVLAILPIILVYPFVQRYFIKGITIGSVKG